jgi:hypothetical protein
MKETIRTDLPLRALLIGLEAITPMAFPAAQAGYSTLHQLAHLAIIPAAVLLIVAWALLRRSSAGRLAAQAAGPGSRIKCTLRAPCSQLLR